MGFMSGFLQGAEGMNNLQNQWAQMQAANQTAQAMAQQNQDQNVAQDLSQSQGAINTGTGASQTAPNANPDGTQPAPVTPVSSQPLGDPSSLPDPDSAKGGSSTTGTDVGVTPKPGSDDDKKDKASTKALETAIKALGTTDAGSGQDATTTSLDPVTLASPAPVAQVAALNTSTPSQTQIPASNIPPAAPQTQTNTVSAPPPQTMLSPADQMANRAPGAVPIAGTPMGTNTPYGQKMGANVLAPTVGGTPRLVNQPDPNLPAGGQGQPQPSQSAPAVNTDTSSQPGFASRVLAAINPISSASAEEAPGRPSLPKGNTSTPAPSQPTAPPSTNPAAAKLPMAKTDDGDTGYKDPGDAPQAAIDTNIPKGGPTAVASPKDKVAPGQTTPTNQSQPAVPADDKVRIPPYDPKPYASLILKAKSNPDSAKALALLEQASKDTGVPAAQIALHWNMESGMNPTAPDGKAGEKGPMQIMPGTQALVDPNHRYDPNNLGDAFHLAGLVLNPLNAAFGEGSPAVAVGYNAGPGNAARFAAGKTDQIPSSALDYMKKCYPGQNVGPSNCTTPPNVDPTALQAAMKQGPDATMRYIAGTAPDNVSLGQKWQAAEVSLVRASLMRGDIKGAQDAQEMILGMSRQGASYALMNADRALAAGDGTTAAQQLAVAHAFFPDGTFGKFGVDSKGQVWAQQFSEKDPSLALGQPFQVTRQNLQPQLVMTQDPNKYLQAIQSLNQQNAQTEFEKQHGAYFGDLIKGRIQMAQDRADTLRTNAAEADATRRYGLALHGQEVAAQVEKDKADAQLKSSTGLLTERENNEAKMRAAQGQRDLANHDAWGKEVETLYGPGAVSGSAKQAADPLVAQMTPQQRSAAALTYRYVRGMDSPSTPMPSPTAYEIANGLATNDAKSGYQLDYKTGAVHRADGSIVAKLPRDAVARLVGARQPPAAARAPNPAIPTGSPMWRPAQGPIPAASTQQALNTDTMWSQ